MVDNSSYTTTLTLLFTTSQPAGLFLTNENIIFTFAYESVTTVAYSCSFNCSCTISNGTSFLCLAQTTVQPTSYFFTSNASAFDSITCGSATYPITNQAFQP
jgi:hypothetical protein